LIKQYGLIGKSIAHSFSPEYFRRKFKNEKIEDTFYSLFPFEHIDLFPSFIQENPNVYGLNVTSPFKQEIIKYIDVLDDTASEVGAVNVLKIDRAHQKTTVYGFNTDVVGFKQTLCQHAFQKHSFALILGTGGVSKAVAYVLSSLHINFTFVSRIKKNSILTYDDINSEIIHRNTLIINCTPLGMYPKIHTFPLLPYDEIGVKHLLIDMVYNPDETIFLSEGKRKGAITQNGFDMFCVQADMAWKIWNAY
jgi:shikimate dehydrogenase